MRTPSKLAAVVLAAASMMGIAACGGGDDDGGGSGVTGATTSPGGTPTGGSGSGGGGGNAQLSAQVGAGEQVYASSCAMCHGDNGSGGNGPALIGEDADLSSHDNGQGLLDYISEQMPASSPGSLTDQQYLDVTAYILEANGALDEPLAAGNAADVTLPGG
ncbi:MAG TPA: cytochrome c [Capillimicrobium sp.]|jgi:cytochrome c5